MRRRLFLAAPLAGLVGFHARAQGRSYRIGYIQLATPEEQEHLTRTFRKALEDLGYREGHSYVLVQRLAMGRQELLPVLAAELAASEVDVIVTGANPAIAAVQQATSTIPVVMAISRDPVGSGFVASLARPGGNITGLCADPTPEVQAKRVELLKDSLPGITRLGVLWNPLAPAAETYHRMAKTAADKLGLTVHSVAIRGRNEMAGAFAALIQAQAEAIVVLPDPMFFTARSQVVALATQHRLPAMFHAREHVDLGGLMSYGASVSLHFRRAALYVDKILKGARAGDLPVEQATHFEFALNLKTAKALGIAIPESVLARADELIE